MRWALLIKRVVNINPQHCPNCGGAAFKHIAAILERPVIEKILSFAYLSHLQTCPPSMAPFVTPDQRSVATLCAKRPAAVTLHTILNPAGRKPPCSDCCNVSLR